MSLVFAKQIILDFFSLRIVIKEFNLFKEKLTGRNLEVSFLRKSLTMKSLIDTFGISITIVVN